MKSPRHIRWPLILAGLTAAAGIGLSVYLQGRIAQTEANAARLTAETLRSNTQQELTLFAEVLESVGALHALSDAVDQAAMDEFVAKGMVYQHEVLGTFGLTQRITPWLRADIEKKEGNQPGAYRVLRHGPDGTWIPAESRLLCYPLTWQSRTNGLNVPVGFDFSSLGKEARQTIKQIETTRRPALDPSPIRDQRSEIRGQESEVRGQGSGVRGQGSGVRGQGSGVRGQGSEIRGQGSEIRGQGSGVRGQGSEIRGQPSSPEASPSHGKTENRNQKSAIFNQQSSIGNPPSYWVFAPVIPRDAPNFVIGFAVAVLHPDAVLKRVAARSASASRLQLKLTNPADSPSDETIRMEHNTWLYRSPLEAIGTHWIFECSTPVTATGRRSTAALTTGLIITALMTSLLLLLAGRTRKIEAEVLARTEDLRIANTRLEENLHERARMEEQMNELAARERRQIGRDLHDSLGQKLTGAVFLSRSLLNGFQKTAVRGQESRDRNQETVNNSELRTLNSELSSQTAHARTLNETLKEAVAQVRNMAHGLAPVSLNDESLCEALKQLAEEMSSLYDTSCVVKCAGTLPELNRKTKEQLYLIAREAVNNAARHAKPEHITIQLTGSESGWTLQIEDDGTGLPGNKPAGAGTCPATGGMGIRIMRHRASLIAASFSITSAPDHGTLVTVTSIA